MTLMVREDNIRPFMPQHLQELMEDVELYGWEPF